MGLPIIGDLIKGVDGIIGRFKASDSEKAEARGLLMKLQDEAAGKWIELESTRIKEAAANVRADAASKGALARAWRPVTMLVFVSLISLYWMGWADYEHLTEAQVLALLDIVKFGLGGFVLSRSAEKIVPSLAEAIRQRKEGS